MLFRYHQKGDTGYRLTRARAVIIDVLIQISSLTPKMASEVVATLRPMSILATGGYGRGSSVRTVTLT